MVIRPADVACDIWRWHNFHFCRPDGGLKGSLVPLSQNEKPNNCGGYLSALLVTRPYAQTLIRRDSGREGLHHGSTMNHCHSASLPLDKNDAHAGRLCFLHTNRGWKRRFHFPVGAEWISKFAECLLFWTFRRRYCDSSHTSWTEPFKLESRPTVGRLIKTVTFWCGEKGTSPFFPHFFVILLWWCNIRPCSPSNIYSIKRLIQMHPFQCLFVLCDAHAHVHAFCVSFLTCGNRILVSCWCAPFRRTPSKKVLISRQMSCAEVPPISAF